MTKQPDRRKLVKLKRARRCVAIRRDTQRCQQSAIPGSDLCGNHAPRARPTGENTP